MITGFLLSAVYAILTGMFILLPAGGELSPSIITASRQLGGYLYGWNIIFPISELVIVIGLSITLLLGIFAVKTILYVVALFRGNSMPSS